MNVVFEIKTVLPQLDAAFERGVWPLHCGSPHLTSGFRQLMELYTSDATIACTCTVMDCLAAESLRYERDRGQRGFAMYFAEHPSALGREIAWTAAIHEGAHYLTDRSPSRDESDEAKAVRDWWASWSCGTEHGRDWARAAMHLSYRALSCGVPVRTSELLTSAGLDDKFTAELRSELVSRVDEPIESILAGGGQPERRAATSTQQAGEPRANRGPRLYMTRYGPVRSFPDGTVETAASLDGRYSAQRFESWAQLEDAESLKTYERESRLGVQRRRIRAAAMTRPVPMYL
jgi:hypothetical protein